jgi:hypothetical protein
MSENSRENKKMKLWQTGLIVLILGWLVNTAFMQAGIGGILRELARLITIIGLILLVIGLLRRNRTSGPPPSKP